MKLSLRPTCEKNPFLLISSCILLGSNFLFQNTIICQTCGLPTSTNEWHSNCHCQPDRKAIRSLHQKPEVRTENQSIDSIHLMYDNISTYKVRYNSNIVDLVMCLGKIGRETNIFMSIYNLVPIIRSNKISHYNFSNLENGK